MNLFDRLKQLKLIEPDPAFSERSRRDVLATQPIVFPFRRFTPWQVFVRVIETGVAAGLVALFIFIMTGGVATSPLAPIPFAAVNPDALHAEAQAIDIQINLANMVYNASRATGTMAQSTVNESHPATRVVLLSIVATSTGATSTATSTATTSSSSASLASSSPLSSSSSPLSIEDVLKALSQ
jgi:hypothetical protein